MSNPKTDLANWAKALTVAAAPALRDVIVINDPEGFDLSTHGLPSAGVVTLNDTAREDLDTPPDEDIIDFDFDVIVAAQSFTAEQGVVDDNDGLHALWWSIVQALTPKIPSDFGFPVRYRSTVLLDIAEGRVEMTMSFTVARHFVW